MSKRFFANLSREADMDKVREEIRMIPQKKKFLGTSVANPDYVRRGLTPLRWDMKNLAPPIVETSGSLTEMKKWENGFS